MSAVARALKLPQQQAGVILESSAISTRSGTRINVRRDMRRQAIPSNTSLLRGVALRAIPRGPRCLVSLRPMASPPTRLRLPPAGPIASASWCSASCSSSSSSCRRWSSSPRNGLVRALGYQRVFATRLVTQALLGGVIGGVAFGSSTPTCASPARRRAEPAGARLQRRSPVLGCDAPDAPAGPAGGSSSGCCLAWGHRSWLSVLQFLHRTPSARRIRCSAATGILRVHGAGRRRRPGAHHGLTTFALVAPSGCMCCAVTSSCSGGA